MMCAQRLYLGYFYRMVCMVCLLVPLVLQQVQASVAYELDGHVMLSGHAGLNLPAGWSPAFSTKGDYIAFLRDGNVWLLRLHDMQIRQLTHHLANKTEDYFLPARVSWDKTDKWIIYTRILHYRYDKDQGLVQTTSCLGQGNEATISTVWIASVDTGESKQLLGPIGDIRRLAATNSLRFASVYEPVFSPNGSDVWFLNAGDLFSVAVSTNDMLAITKPVIVARLGKLDLATDRASTWSIGAIQLAWDATTDRLYLWRGRFEGTGESEYYSIPYHNDKLGRVISFHPKLSRKLALAMQNTNVQGCAVDSSGYLWVYAYIGQEQGFRWTRQDLKYVLPTGADRPSFH